MAIMTGVEPCPARRSSTLGPNGVTAAPAPVLFAAMSGTPGPGLDTGALGIDVEIRHLDRQVAAADGSQRHGVGRWE